MIGTEEFGQATVAPPRVRWWLIGCVAGLCSAFLLLVFWIDRSLPTIGQMREMIRRPSVEVELKPDGALEFRAEQFPIPIDLASLPDFVGQTLVEMEDRRFRWHPGFDPITLARAAAGYAHGLVGGSRAGGGSTLTQQVARAVFLSQDRTLARKAREIALAIKLELVLSKDQILELYLNRIHFGQGLTGIEQAARHYFGVRARDLNRYQAAMLVGMIPRPREWNPVSDVGAAHRRARLVLDTLRNRELLLPAMHDRLVRTWRSRPLTKLRTGDRNVPRVAPGYLRDWLRAEILALHLAPGEPRRLILTLDPLAQVYAQLAAARLVEAGRTLGATEAAILVLGTDGAVRAMVGGVNYQQSQFNRAAQARRQPASAFKPIVYAAALEAGNTPDTLIEDTPIRIDGKPWPRNFDDRYRGRIPLVTALAESRNAATVRLAGKIGQDRIIDVARRMGISSPLFDRPSLPLGVDIVTPIELSRAYAVLANGGYAVEPFGLMAVQDRSARVLYWRPPPPQRRVLSSRTVRSLNGMLREAMRRGTAERAAFDRRAAGKTGTSQDSRDAWFAGYTGELVGVIWVGQDANRPMRGVTGGSLPAEQWRHLMANIHSDRRPRPPSGVDD